MLLPRLSREGTFSPPRRSRIREGAIMNRPQSGSRQTPPGMDVYEAIYSRRDIRRFRPGLIPDEVLLRILDAAHHAGSVGFMQPWNFIVIRDPEFRRRVKALFEAENNRAAENYSGERRELYRSLKLEG